MRSQMDLIANNIANMNTPGYRAQNMVFLEYIADPKKIEDELSMVIDHGHYQDTRPGPMRRTGNPLDVALQGPGWFGVQRGDETMFTRAGNFQLNVNGEIVTGRGDLVAGEGGGPIIIPAGSKEIRIAEDGSVATEQGVVGRLMVMEFENQQDLEAVGDGLHRSPNEGQPATQSRVISGMVEGANVQPVVEMTRMIDVLRTYQSTQNMLRNEHDRQRTMIQRLSSSG